MANDSGQHIDLDFTWRFSSRLPRDCRWVAWPYTYFLPQLDSRMQSIPFYLLASILQSFLGPFPQVREPTPSGADSGKPSTIVTQLSFLCSHLVPWPNHFQCCVPSTGDRHSFRGSPDSPVLLGSQLLWVTPTHTFCSSIWGGTTTARYIKEQGGWFFPFSAQFRSSHGADSSW
jgi:hypothetical protein